LEVIQKCDNCQRHAPIPILPKNNLIPVSTSWPFQKWGIDIVGPFSEAPGKIRFLIVAIDYFSKWVEAKPLATITGQKVKRFVWENIMCRFGLPHEIVSDNGKQFEDNPFKTWCEQLKITQIFTSVAHPQANGQVERVNISIVEGIKIRLGKEKRVMAGTITTCPMGAPYNTQDKQQRNSF
jgi:transposase InsO family protein